MHFATGLCCLVRCSFVVIATIASIATPPMASADSSSSSQDSTASAALAGDWSGIIRIGPQSLTIVIGSLTQAGAEPCDRSNRAEALLRDLVEPPDILRIRPRANSRRVGNGNDAALVLDACQDPVLGMLKARIEVEEADDRGSASEMRGSGYSQPGLRHAAYHAGPVSGRGHVRDFLRSMNAPRLAQLDVEEGRRVLTDYPQCVCR